MRKRKWNKADKVLGCAFLFFFFALAQHLNFPDSLLLEGLLFAADAALVGGIADWFAVTALFRKQLGFPYHTAILPSHRQAFINGSIEMVQREFFSRRKIFRHLERLHLMPMLMEWLAKPEVEGQLVHRLIHYARDIVLRQDAGRQSEIAAESVRRALQKIEPEDLFSHCGAWLRESGRDHELLARISMHLREHAASDETRASILQMLKDYENAKTKSVWSILAASIAEGVGAIDLREGAVLIQNQLLAMLDELGEKDSPLQQKVLELFYEKAAVLNEDPEFHQLTHELKDNLLAELPLEEVLRRLIDHVRAHFAEDKARQVDPMEEHLPVLHSRLAEIIEQEYRRTLHLIEDSPELRHTIGHFLYDLIARSALHAQSLIGVVITDVLSRLTDEQLNSLVYDKVEPDLLWIRMNGSIVGAGIGVMLFVILQIVS